MKNILLILCVLSPLSPFLIAQENLDEDLEIEMDEIIDNIIAIDDEDLIDILEDLNKYQILFASVEFNDKTYFLGRDIGIEQSNIVSQLMYENSNGLFIGVSGSYYSKFDPKWDVTVLSAGYGKSFGKNDNIRAEIGYSRYLFSNSASNDFENSIDLGFNAVTKNGALGSSINTSYLFGSKTGFQSSASVYGDIKLFNLNTSTGSKVTFGPDLAFIFGSENIDTSRIDNLGIDLPFIDRIIDSFETFSLRNIQLELPIILEFNDLHIQASYIVNFPKAFDFEDELDSTSFINVGVSYIFNLK